MKIKILAVGKLKENFLREACMEYEKRLSRFCNLEICEVKDLKNPDLSSEALCREVLEKEGKEILRNLGDGFTVALCVEGVSKTSEEFAQILSGAAMNGGRLNFIIGSSLGLSGEVKKRADLRLSISDMTLPHGLARVVLLEQIYRGYKILSGEDYHK
ncbi:MAG TPA: 23S rRNA (pseudouridine(1915)-N(3))-methyltransferase RlmH [Candidatus Moranbacteria bacterium]|nr:23S rRNA (pseudouridine(1915)-N(3))-methyltransferase RlmH [Candidatus Moranbacteria bacterium]